MAKSHDCTLKKGRKEVRNMMKETNTKSGSMIEYFENLVEIIDLKWGFDKLVVCLIIVKCYQILPPTHIDRLKLSNLRWTYQYILVDLHISKENRIQLNE